MIPQLMSLNQWRRERFAEKPPTEGTVRRWCEHGDIPAKKIGGKWFVMVNEELRTTGDDLVDSVLRS